MRIRRSTDHFIGGFILGFLAMAVVAVLLSVVLP